MLQSRKDDMSTQIAELKTQAIEQRQRSKPIMDLIQKNLVELEKHFRHT